VRQQAVSGEALILIGPLDADPVADQAPVAALAVGAGAQARVPFERRTDDPSDRRTTSESLSNETGSARGAASLVPKALTPYRPTAIPAQIGGCARLTALAGYLPNGAAWCYRGQSCLTRAS